MMENERITPVDDINAPWAKRVEVLNVEFEGGISMIRLRIREGKRFTIMDLDFETAARLGLVLSEWAKKNTPS